MKLRVILSPKAETQLNDTYNYIAAESSPATAQRFADAILDRCQSLEQMPLRGLRTLTYRKRVVIAYSVDDRNVTILEIFYGGQDFETMLREDELRASPVSARNA